MDALEELKRALDQRNAVYIPPIILNEEPDSSGYTTSFSVHHAVKNDANGRFAFFCMEHLPALLAELEARRAQAGDIPNAAGFTPSATRAMK